MLKHNMELLQGDVGFASVIPHSLMSKNKEEKKVKERYIS